MTDSTVDDAAEETKGDVTTRYTESNGERRLTFDREGQRAVVAQNIDGYAMLKVRSGGDELERYYGFDMALDHVAEILGVGVADLPVPEPAEDMGM